jgi:hypothetical protein
MSIFLVNPHGWMTRFAVKQVSGSIKFIPHRPRELVSGGYDTALLHFDFVEGKILSSHKMRMFITHIFVTLPDIPVLGH